MRILVPSRPPLIGLRINRGSLTGMLWIAACGWLLVGCDGSAPAMLSSKPSQKSRDAIALAEQGGLALSHVVAQGQLEPLRGVLSIMAPPGDRVARIAVTAGDSVAKGDLLVELESRRVKEIELDIAETKLAEGQARLEAEKAAASARLQVARTKLKQSETQLEQAQGKLRIAESPGGSLDLLRRAAELGERKLEQLRSASNDPSTVRLVSGNRLEEESLKVSEARAQYEVARVDANDAIATAQLGVLAAQQEIVAAEKSMAAAQASASLESLGKQIELLRLNMETANLTSPLAGKVLEIDTMPGQATTTMPLLHLADTSQMVCVAEVNVADLARIEVGQRAEIISPGLARALQGKVQRIHQLIASPQMASPFPLAPVDRYTADVTIAIDPADSEAAAQRIRMQVEVRILIEPATATSSPAARPSPPTPPGDPAAAAAS